jgi:hypothetical protein
MKKNAKHCLILCFTPIIYSNLTIGCAQINRRLAHHAFCRDVATRVRARCDAVVAGASASASGSGSVSGSASGSSGSSGSSAAVLSDAQRVILQQLHAACSVLVRCSLSHTHFHCLL